MNSFRSGLLILLVLGLWGCSRTATPDVSNGIQKALQEAGFKDLSVKDDLRYGVVTLRGDVVTDADKTRAESIAKSLAGGQVVADEIAVLPPGAESRAQTVDSDLDKGVDSNLHAALVQNGLDKNVSYQVKNGVVILNGNVDSPDKRTGIANLAANVPNVQQVVNELQVKQQKQKATASQ